MIGLDTNVLVRYLVADDPDQLALVDRLVAEAVAAGERLYLNSVVLAEAAWVLESVYGYRKAQILESLEAVARTRQFSLADRDAVVRALERYREGTADFSDYLIGELNRSDGCRQTVTFDRSLGDSPAVRVLGKRE